MIAGSIMLLRAHAEAVVAMRETGLPAAVRLPVIEQRMKILEEQNEVAQLQAALVSGSVDEQVQTYVLPTGTGTTRSVATLDILLSSLERTKTLLWHSPVSVGSFTDESADLKVLPMTVELRLTREGWEQFQLFIEASGLLTVGDIASKTEMETLLRATEQDNPAAVAALEQFFATDILRYSEEPKPFDEGLLKSFSSQESLEAIRGFLGSSRLQHIRGLLKNMSGDLRSAHVWPLPFFDIRTAEVQLLDDGTVQAKVEVGAYGRVR